MTASDTRHSTGEVPLPDSDVARRSFSRRPSILLLRFGPTVALVLVLLAFGLANHRFLSGRSLQAIADAAAVPCIVGVGATFVILLGRIDLSVEGVMGSVSILLALLVANTRNSVDLGFGGLLVALALGAAFGLFNAFLHIIVKIPSFLATLGTWFVGLGLATVLFNGSTSQISDTGLTALAQGTTLAVPNSAILALICVAVAAWTLRSTRFGRRVYAIGGDERIATMLGLRLRAAKTGCFVIAGVCSAMAAVLVTLQIGQGTVAAGSGSSALFAGITAVVIGGTSLSGGRGSVWNTMIGAVVLAAIANGLIIVNASPNIQDIVRGAIIVVGVAAVGWSARTRTKVVK